MSTFKKSTITLAGKPREVLLINYSPENEKESKTIDKMHHIHILDRSYSMSGSIVGLMEDVKKTFRAIPVGDYISVVWFSSEGQNGVVIKGYKRTENDDFKDIDNLIDSIKYCVGCTCFNEPMALVKSIINEMKPLCPYYNVTLFTDGCSCCNISPDKDYDKTCDIANSFKNDIMALNTLGYGYYYDKDFLTILAEISDFGKYEHSSNVKEYSEIFTHNYERVKDMIVENVDIKAPYCEILYLNSKSTKLNNESMLLSSIEKRKNQFLVILPNDNNNYTVTINDEVINATDMKSGKILDSTVKNLQYAYAYENYYTGKRDVCLDVLNDIKDKYFIDEQLNAFTIDETSKFSKSLNKAIFNNKERMKSGKAPDNYLPDNDAFCIMDLLKILSMGKDNFYVPDISSYKRIGLQVVDTFNLFEPKRDYEILAPFNDNLVFNKTMLNISVKFTRDGIVNINPKSAKKVGLPEKIESKQFQTHTIIKDGHLNIDSIIVKISEDTYKDLISIEFDKGINILKNIGRNDERVYEIDLTTLPVINRQYLNDSSIEKVLNMVVENTKLEAQQKVLNYMITLHPYKEYTVTNYNEGSTINYTEEQVEVLKEHGLNEHLTYSGVNRKVTEKNENDYYEARELEFQLKGSATIPSIQKGLETYDAAISKGKEPNFVSKEIHDYYEYVNNIAFQDTIKGSKEEKETLEKLLAGVKIKLIENRIELNTIKIAKVLTSSWWEELVVDKDKYTYTNNGDTLVVKTSYEKVYFN